MKKIQIGDIARDTITGFQGVVIGRSTYLHNVDRLSLQPQELRDGKRQDHRSFDEPGLEYVGASGIRVEPPNDKRFGMGDVVRDPVTGLQGTVVSQSLWSSGCYSVTVQPRGLDKDGVPLAQQYFQSQDLELVEPAAQKEESARKTGGPLPEPRRVVR